MRIVLLRKQPVDLYKLLKFEGLANSGGEAKALISEGLVTLNGKVETRKRKKIFNGDYLQLGEVKLQIKLDPELLPPEKQTDPETEKQTENHTESKILTESKGVGKV